MTGARVYGKSAPAPAPAPARTPAPARPGPIPTPAFILNSHHLQLAHNNSPMYNSSIHTADVGDTEFVLGPNMNRGKQTLSKRKASHIKKVLLPINADDTVHTPLGSLPLPRYAPPDP